MSEDARKEIVRQVVADVGGAFVAGLGYIGDRLGLFRALAASGPVSSAALAGELKLHERYVREWLKAMVSAGYAEHDAMSGEFFMTGDQQAVLVDEDSPVFAAGAFQFAIPSLEITAKLIECFRSGKGIAYADLGPEVPVAIDRMHRAWFNHLLTGVWLPGASGIDQKLRAGTRVLDVGCGTGRSSIAVGKAYPNSSVVGLDPHPESIAEARKLQEAAGIPNLEFREAALESLPESDKFGLVLAIDCIHDMRDPAGALGHIRKLLAQDGALFWSEPTGSKDPARNRNPPGRMRAALSPYHCLTVSLASGGEGLGTIIGEAGARDLAAKAGFKQFEKLPIDNAMQQFFLVRRE